MSTQQNIFIRKFGHMAVIITITDWKDYCELEKFSKHESPDLLVSSITSKSIYSNMMPSMLINTSEAKDITDETKGVGIAGILTGHSNAGNIFAYKKLNGLSIVEDISGIKL